MALFFGGLAQFLAGMWEFATGNTFGATGESGTFHSISLHHTQVMAASAIIKTWTICHRMILCRALLRASQSAAYFNADLGAEAYPRLVAARLCTRCLADYLFLGQRLRPTAHSGSRLPPCSFPARASAMPMVVMLGWNSMPSESISFLG